MAVVYGSLVLFSLPLGENRTQRTIDIKPRSEAEQQKNRSELTSIELRTTMRNEMKRSGFFCPTVSDRFLILKGVKL